MTTQVKPATETLPYSTIKAHYVSNLSQRGPIISLKTHLDIEGDYSLLTTGPFSSLATLCWLLLLTNTTVKTEGETEFSYEGVTQAMQL